MKLLKKKNALGVLKAKLTCGPPNMALKNECLVKKSALDVTGSDCGPSSPRAEGKLGGNAGGPPGW